MSNPVSTPAAMQEEEGSSSKQSVLASLQSSQQAAIHGELGSTLEFSQHVISNSELTLKEVIGSGAEGKVYRGMWTNIDVAVKEVIAPEDVADTADEHEGLSREALHRAQVLLLRQTALLTSLNHPNLVRFCGVCLDPPLLVMEYYKHGSLFHLLEKGRRQWVHRAADDKHPNKYIDYLTWDRRLEILHDIAAGMMYLHHKHYVHGDLRSPNIFIGQDGRVKVGDFGFVQKLQSSSSLQAKRMTHPRWVAPELMTDSRLSAASDVYSFGIIMYEVLTWQLPFHDLSREEVVIKVVHGHRPDIPAGAGLPPGTSSHAFLDWYIRLMQECWQQDPARRPTSQQISARLQAMVRWRMVFKKLKQAPKEVANKAPRGPLPAIPAAADPGGVQTSQQPPGAMTKQQLHSKLLGGDPMRAAEARSDRPAELLAGASSSAAEMPPKVIPVPLLDVYDLVGLKEAPGSSKGCKVYHGVWFEADVTVLEYLPEKAWQSPGKDHPSEPQGDPSTPEALKGKVLAAVQQLPGLSHPNIMRLCGYSFHPPALVTEYQRHGTVSNLLLRAQQQHRGPGSSLRKQNKLVQYLNWKRRLGMLQDTASGLLYLHSRGYLLGQLSSANMFVGADGKVRLGMFDLLDSNRSPAAQDVAVTKPRWVAPEVLEQQTPTAASSVYSFGMVMYLMLTWQIPFQDLVSNAEVVKYVTKGGRPVIPPAAELPPGTAAAAGLQQYIQLMQQCWEHDPNHRPPLLQVAQALKALATAGTVQTSAGKSLMLPPIVTQKAQLEAEDDSPPEAANLPTVGEEDFSPPGTPPPSIGISSLGFQSQYLRSLIAKGTSEGVQQQAQEPQSPGSKGSSDAQTGGQHAAMQQQSSAATTATADPRAPAADTQTQETATAAEQGSPTAADVPPPLPGASAYVISVAIADNNQLTTQSREPPQPAPSRAPSMQPAASEQLNNSPWMQSAGEAAAGQGDGYAASGVVQPAEGLRPAVQPLQAEQQPSATYDSPQSASYPQPIRAAAATEARSAAAATTGAATCDVNSVRELVNQLERLQPQLTSHFLRLLVLYGAHVVCNTVASVEQQLQLVEQGAIPARLLLLQQQQRQQVQQQQQLVAVQLQALVVLLQCSQAQQLPPQNSTLQAVGHLAVLLISLASWRSAAGGVYSVQTSSSSSGSSSMLPAAISGVYALMAICLLGWLLLPPAVATAASIAAGSYVIWRASSNRQVQPERTSATAEGDGIFPRGSVSLLGFTVFGKATDIAGMLTVALQPDSTSSSVGYASWSATWQPEAAASGTAAAGQGAPQQVVLHTLPLHRYRVRGQQRRATNPAAGGGATNTNQGESAGQPEQQSVHSFNSKSAATAGTAMGSATDEMVYLQQHPVLSSTAKDQPRTSSLMHLLECWAQRQQQRAQVEQQQQQQEQRQTLPCGHVLWVCLDPPMLLETLPVGSTIAAWLLQQQQQQQQQPTEQQPYAMLGIHTATNQSSSDSNGAQVPPFQLSQDLWPSVLGWLQQVAASLAELHEVGCVHGGLHAGAVYLVDGATAGSNSSCSSSSAGSRKPQTAVLSLAAPWQHAVTPGCVVDGSLAPPEVLTAAQHPTSSPAVDVYCFGMLMWQVATGWVPQQQMFVAADKPCYSAVDADAVLLLYDELHWCAEMINKHGTTFPGAGAGAAATASDAFNRLSMHPASLIFGMGPAIAAVANTACGTGEDCRHGSLPSMVSNWPPAGYRQIMFDCCSSAPDQRPSMTVVCQRLKELDVIVCMMRGYLDLQGATGG